MTLPAQYAWLKKEPGPRILLEALRLHGIKETPGPGNTREIMLWARKVRLAKIYKADSIAWCGLFMAYVALQAGWQPPINPLWARNWASFGTKARMIVTGDLYYGPGETNPVTFDTLLYNGLANSKASYLSAASDHAIWDGTKWILTNAFTGIWTSTDPVATPDLVTTWTPDSTENGTITITPGVSSAAQVITAGVADAATALLAVPSASGTVTGAVAAVTATNLSGGTGTIISGNSGYDFEGVAIPSITTLLAINIEVVSGSATIASGSNVFPIPALIYGSTTGTLLTTDLVVTATADDTVVNITVLGVD
jgi:hypothetical protein